MNLSKLRVNCSFRLSFRYLLLGIFLAGFTLGCGLDHETISNKPNHINQPIESCGLSITHPSKGQGEIGRRSFAVACGPGTKQEPDPRAFSRPVEAYARYVGQTRCSPSAKAGMKAFRSLILKTYPCTGDYGITRRCSSGSKSEHKEGRAWDWKLNYPHPAADAVIKWLLATRKGVAHAYARRLGVMYMIWNRKIWKAYQASKGWQKYTGSSAHRDHIHFSFSHDGGNMKTSFWSGKVEEPKKLNAAKVSQGAKFAVGPSSGASFSLCPGQNFQFYFQVKNTGNIDWTDVNQNQAGKAVRLGYKKGSFFGAPKRISVNTTGSRVVKPGQSVTFTVNAKAPNQAGVLDTHWQMVSELVTWFGPEMKLSFSVTPSPPGHGASCTLQGQSGNCGKGVMKCSAKGLSCVGATAGKEVCDNKDNDCNGLIDDALVRSCYSGRQDTKNVGKCRGGTERCQVGRWGSCLEEILPDAKETCGNTIDDDCDGQLDEGCGSQGGACEDKDGDGYGAGESCQGQRDCDDSDKTIYPGAPEVCDNGKDDDCRGGDRPCQNKVKPDPGVSKEPPSGTDKPKEGGNQTCEHPPCGVTSFSPGQQKLPKLERGCGCSQLAQDRPINLLSLLLLLLFAYSYRRFMMSRHRKKICEFE